MACEFIMVIASFLVLLFFSCNQSSAKYIRIMLLIISVVLAVGAVLWVIHVFTYDSADETIKHWNANALDWAESPM